MFTRVCIDLFIKQSRNSGLPSNCQRGGSDLLVLRGDNFGAADASVFIDGQPCLAGLEVKGCVRHNALFCCTWHAMFENSFGLMFFAIFVFDCFHQTQFGMVLLFQALHSRLVSHTND